MSHSRACLKQEQHLRVLWFQLMVPSLSRGQTCKEWSKHSYLIFHHSEHLLYIRMRQIKRIWHVPHRSISKRKEVHQEKWKKILTFWNENFCSEKMPHYSFLISLALRMYSTSENWMTIRLLSSLFRFFRKQRLPKFHTQNHTDFPHLLILSNIEINGNLWYKYNPANVFKNQQEQI